MQRKAFKVWRTLPGCRTFNKKDDIEEFISQIEMEAENRYFIKDMVNVNADMELGIEDINEELYDRIQSAGPYGEGFEAPCFCIRNVIVLSDRMTEKNII